MPAYRMGENISSCSNAAFFWKNNRSLPVLTWREIQKTMTYLRENIGKWNTIGRSLHSRTPIPRVGVIRIRPIHN